MSVQEIIQQRESLASHKLNHFCDGIDLKYFFRENNQNDRTPEDLSIMYLFSVQLYFHYRQSLGKFMLYDSSYSIHHYTPNYHTWKQHEQCVS